VVETEAANYLVGKRRFTRAAGAGNAEDRGFAFGSSGNNLRAQLLADTVIFECANQACERGGVMLVQNIERGRGLLRRIYGHLMTGDGRLPEDWVAQLERHEHSSRLSLGRLGPKDLARLLMDAFGSVRLAQDLAYRIGTKSDGNPFFAFEIIRGLREGQFITQQPDGTWIKTQMIEDIQIPDSVRDLIQARIARLTGRVVCAASLLVS